MSSSYPPSGGRPMQSCQRCGMSLPPNEVRCGNCGFSNVPGQGGNFGGSPSNMPNGGPGPQAAFNQGPYGSGTWGSAGGPGPAGAQRGQTVGAPTASGLYTPPSIPQPMTPGAMPAQQQMNSGTFQSSPARFSVNQPPPASSAGKNSLIAGIPLPSTASNSPISKTRVMMGVIVLIILLLSGTIVGISYFRKETAPPRTTVVPIPTPNVPPTFSDLFNDNTYGWNLESEPGKYAVTIGAGNLTLEDDDHKLLWEQLPGQRTYSDFTLYVNATLTKGDQSNGYGIYIRGAPNPSSDLATYYRFELYGDGGYAIYKGVIDNGNSGYTKLVDYTANSAINKAGKTNDIRITAQGSSLSLMVNGHNLQTITDTSYSKGTVAFFVSNTTDAKAGATAQFTQFGIYPAGA